jgi:hypothetical protein
VLHRFGFFSEFFEREEAARRLGSIHEKIGGLGDDVDTGAVATYLRSGNSMVDTMEAVFDVITGESFYEVSGASSLLTDGVWLWRYDLAHYVEKYRLWVPPEFVEHAASLGFQAPVLSEEQLVTLAKEERESHGSDWWVGLPTHVES